MTFPPGARSAPSAGPLSLVLRDITKKFGATAALRGASLAIRAGELHALLGENGAGKSTLMHVADGIVRADSGAMELLGVPGFPATPRIAATRGIAMVHQHFTSIPALTVAENIALTANWPVHPRHLRARVVAFLEKAGLALDPDAVAGALSVGLRQRLEIAKALASAPAVLLLDEPTGVLAPAEAAELFTSLHAFVADGGSALLITHRVDEALAEADAITVLRQGAVTLSLRRDDTPTREQLLTAMLGPDIVDAGVPAPRHTPGEVRVALEGITVAREGRGGMAVVDASLQLRAGEIVAVAALEGSGQRELLRAVAGVLPVTSGARRVTGRVAFVPEDRTTEALIGDFTLMENLELGALTQAGSAWVDWRAVRARTAELIDAAEVKADGPDARAATLSGGNQQKFVNARALAMDPAVLVAEHPSRGLDVRAAAAVHRQLRQAADRGVAVLVHSPDLDEALGSADRVVVMAGGRLREVPPGSDRRLIGEMMLDATGEKVR